MLAFAVLVEYRRQQVLSCSQLRGLSMALMSPRGLKIRLELPWAFGLLARLWTKDSRTDAFRVLKTCESIESVPSVLAFAAAVTAAFYSEWPTWAVSCAMAAGTAVGVLLTQLGLFIIIRPLGILLVAQLWSWVSGYGVLFVAGLVIAWGARGWPGVLWWLVGMVGAFFVRQALEVVFMSRAKRVIGEPFTAAELNFFNAYRLHADRLGVTNDLEVPDEEIESNVWRDCLLDYAEKYPEAVARFPDQEELVRAIGPRLHQRRITELVQGLVGRRQQSSG